MKPGMGNRAGAISSEPSPERASSSTAPAAATEVVGAEVEVGPGVGGTGQSRPAAARKSAAKAASAWAAAMDRGEAMIHGEAKGARGQREK